MKLYKVILISIVAVILVSCTSTPKLAETLSIPTPDIGIDVQNGKHLEVTAPNGWNSFKTNKPISLEIRNISKEQIILDQSFGARIFVRTEDQWIEVKNKEIYENDQITLVPDENHDPLKTASTFIRPDLADYSTETYIRIFVIGTLIENGKETNKVASYIDVNLNP
jgi:hypothetical protein